jgi:tetratricopeptide (TPR) repeat protein
VLEAVGLLCLAREKVSNLPQRALALAFLFFAPFLALAFQDLGGSFDDSIVTKADPEKIRPILEAYQQALVKTPNALGMNLQFGLHLWQLGELEESRQAFERERRLDSGNLHAQAMLGIIKTQERQYLEAAVDLQSVVEKDPRLTQIWHPLGQAFFELGKYEDAKRCLENAAEAEPGVPQIQALLAKTYSRLSDGPAASRASELYAEALKLKTARDLAAIGKWREALNVISEYVSAFPHGSGGWYVKAAVLFNGFHQLDPAIDAARSSITHNGANVEARNLLAILLLAKGDSKGFESELENVLRFDPMDTRANYYLGRFEADQGRLAASREHLEKALLLRPNDAVIGVGLAVTYEKLGMNQQAESQYKKVIEGGRNLPPDGSPYTYYGAFLLNEGRNSEALQYLNRAVGLPSARPEAFYLAGIACLKNGNLQSARDYFKQAIQRRPEYPEARSALASLMQKSDGASGERGVSATQHQERE